MKTSFLRRKLFIADDASENQDGAYWMVKNEAAAAVVVVVGAVKERIACVRMGVCVCAFCLSCRWCVCIGAMGRRPKRVPCSEAWICVSKMMRHSVYVRFGVSLYVCV